MIRKSLFVGIIIGVALVLLVLCIQQLWFMNYAALNSCDVVGFLVCVK